MQHPQPGRPVGVVLSALALGLAALVLFLLSLGSLAAALGGPHLTGLLGVVPIYGALACWAIATLIGLLRLRPWVSVMVIAGCLIAFSLLFAVSMLGVQSAAASGSYPLTPIASPADLHRALVLLACVAFFLAVLGIVWLVYFASRRTREAFRAAAAQQPSLRASASSTLPYPRSAVRSRSAMRPPAPDPLTDFTVARPLETPSQIPAMTPPQPAPADEPLQQPEPLPEADIAASAPRRDGTAGAVQPLRARRPLAVTIVAFVALVNASMTLLGIVSPLPAFLFGMVVSGWPLHLYSLVWASAAAIAGLGLLRLQRPAWVLSFVLLGISSIQFLVLLLPRPRARYIGYMSALQQHATFGSSQPALPSNFFAATILLGILVGATVLGLFAAMLWRAREAFALAVRTPAPGEPPAMSSNFPQV